MAYNPFPVTYPGYYNNPYYQQHQQQTIQQSGFVPVRSEQEARSYPVAPGNSVTFKDENAPYCYVKTMGFNQLDSPLFERYRLVKEETPAEALKSAAETANAPGDTYKDFALKADLSEIWGEIDEIKKKLAEKRPVKARKVEDNDEE